MSRCLLCTFTITISLITSDNIVQILTSIVKLLISIIRLLDLWFFNLSLYLLIVAAFATYLIIDTKVILQN